MRGVTLCVLALSLMMTVGCGGARRFEDAGTYQAPKEALSAAAALSTATELLTGLPDGAGKDLKVTAKGLSGTVKRTNLSRAQHPDFEWTQVKSIHISKHKRSGSMMVDFLPESGDVRHRLLRLEMASVEDARKLADAVMSLRDAK